LVSRGKVYLFDIFEKNDKVNLTKRQSATRWLRSYA
jgi:hypothetical protein